MKIAICVTCPLISVPSYVSSKDAYMLIYTRVSDETAEDLKGDLDPQPPPRALRVVEELNVNHEKECEEYIAKCDLLESFGSTFTNLSLGRKPLRNNSTRNDEWSWTSTPPGACHITKKILSYVVGKPWKRG